MLRATSSTQQTWCTSPPPGWVSTWSSCSLYSAMDDAAFLDAFERGVLPNAAFHHRDHLRLSWLYLRRDGSELGSQRVMDGIRHFAAAHGAADRFHVTLTQ